MMNGSVLQENILSLINEWPVKHCIVFYTGLWTWLYSISLGVFDDAEILEISDVKVNNMEFSIDGKTDDLLKSGDLYISYSIEVFYEYFDPYSSPYDSETKTFVYHNIIKNTSRFDVDLVVPFVLEFDKKTPFDESKPLSQLTDLIHVDVNFSNSEVLLTDYDEHYI